MHFYALDEKENLVSAHQADKRLHYYCRECLGLVKSRGGLLRQMHFYHLEPNQSCRQNGKSLVHLQVLHYLQSCLPDCDLEKEFPLINRIADVYWEKEGLIIEIQCSSISAREIEERNQDYARIGYQVLWILHDRLFNRHRLTAAEYFLQDSLHYFTNIDSEGVGYIYDQWDRIEKGKRVFTLGFRKVNFFSYHSHLKESLALGSYPPWIKKRLESWRGYFTGDYLDYFLTMQESEKAALLSALSVDEQSGIMQVGKKLQPGVKRALKKLIRLISFSYRLGLNYILEKLAK
ncbi:hypothetical protein DB42_AA00380 [Neochlamydia sp. EPS4]|uniref:competence protein CoiA n=1 Tax=Neochlamydia sp. EPS4 TaxID=1478175 RepID=UPI00058400A4|nr:competence protein CoiA family protein [Neochlamydia sp. EPS4]KIC75550.1 hypothetical protein DB42_AA00380 [Neochlamydia sp. EPS4]